MNARDRVAFQNIARLLRDGDVLMAQQLAESVLEVSEAPQGPRPLDLRALSENDPQPPRFIVAGWLPEGQVTLFAGHGGSGKSLIALTVAICIAAGRAFFGLRCERRRVLFLSFEDSAAVLHWRLHRVCQMLGVDLASLDGWLFVFDATERGEPLFVEARDGYGTTPAFDWLREQIAATGAQVTVIDGTADAFAGNENARAQVRAFVQALRRALPREGAALLLHHVDALSAHSGSSKGYSGSTAWHNSCRARWYLRLADDGDDADPSRVVLELRKSNHGKPGATLGLRFSESAHCFVPECEPVASPLDRALRESDEREAVLAMIRKADAAGDPLPAATSGTRTVYSAAAARSDCPDSLKGRAGRGRFLHHVEALRQAGAIRVVELRKANGHAREVLRAAP
jgi:RecA-family ATPase